jgi:hypothetical protein
VPLSGSFRRLELSFEQCLLVAVLKTARLANGPRESGWLGKRFPTTTLAKMNFKPRSKFRGDSMWLPAVVVRRARPERIGGKRQRLVPIALCAIAPRGSAWFEEEICNG